MNLPIEKTVEAWRDPALIESDVGELMRCLLEGYGAQLRESHTYKGFGMQTDYNTGFTTGTLGGTALQSFRRYDFLTPVAIKTPPHNSISDMLVSHLTAMRLRGDKPDELARFAEDAARWHFGDPRLTLDIRHYPSSQRCHVVTFTEKYPENS